MNLRKRDLQRIVHEVKDFVWKLQGSETTAELRDSLNFTLLLLHKYYKRLRNKTKTLPLLDGSISLSSSLGSLSPASPYIQPIDKFEWRWFNLDPSKLNASFGHGDKSNLLPEIFYVLKDGDVDKLKELIAKDSDCVNEIDPLGRSTALYCVNGGSDDYLKCLDVLIEHNVDLLHDANDGSTCLHVAVIQNNEQMIEKLLSQSKELISAEDNEGRYPLHFAAGYSNTNIIQKLLSAGADKTCLDNDELTPVMWACHFDKYENVELILGIKGDDDMRFEVIDTEVKDQDTNGHSLIHWSVSGSNNKECFKMLFSEQYFGLVDNNGKTVLHTMAEKGACYAAEEYFAMVESPNVEALDYKDRTALHYACMCGHGEVVDILLSHGASPDVIDKQGLTPYEYAKSKNLQYCMLVIQSHQKYRDKITVTKDDAVVEKEQHASSKINANVTSNNVNKTTTKLTNNSSQQPVFSPTPPINQIISPELERKLSWNDPIKEGKISRNAPVLERKVSSDISVFDTPQEEENKFDDRTTNKNNLERSFKDQTGNNSIPNVISVDRKNDRVDRKNDRYSVSHDSSDIDDDLEMNMNNQLIVLVDHHGSDDDDLVVDVDNGNYSNRSEEFKTKGIDHVDHNENIDFEDDHDLLDAPPFARNGSITTVGVMSEGTFAFNSASNVHSVSSLVSSDESDEEREDDRLTKNSKQPQLNSLDNQQKKVERPGSHNPKKQFERNGNMSSANRNVHSPSPPVGNIVGPMPPPPPSSFYQPPSSNKSGGNNNADILVLHGSERKEKKKPRSNSNSFKLDNLHSLEERHPPPSMKSSKQLGQSWPSASQPKPRESKKQDRHSLIPLDPPRSAGARLAPLTTGNKPRPPSFK